MTKKTFYLNLAQHLYFSTTDLGQDSGVIKYLGNGVFIGFVIKLHPPPPPALKNSLNEFRTVCWSHSTV